jgi:hypothetical protein
MSFGNDQTNFNQGMNDQPQKPRGWWSRNWKWFIPVVFVVMVFICCGGPLGFLYFGFKQLLNSEPYKITMQKIADSEELKQELGEPIESVLNPPPSVRVENANGRGEADARWTIKGPKGQAKAHITARLNNDKWEIGQIEVNLSNGKKIIIPIDSGNQAPTFSPQDNTSTPETKEPPMPNDPNLNISLPEDGGEKK